MAAGNNRYPRHNFATSLAQTSYHDNRYFDFDICATPEDRTQFERKDSSAGDQPLDELQPPHSPHTPAFLEDLEKSKPSGRKLFERLAVREDHLALRTSIPLPFIPLPHSVHAKRRSHRPLHFARAWRLPAFCSPSTKNPGSAG